MLKIYTPENAKDTILKRVALDDMSVSSRMLEGIKTIFGESLSPEEAVRRILRDIRSHGDSALQKWSMTLDGLNTN